MRASWYSRWSAEDTTRLKALFDAGLSSNEIARALNLSPPTVRSKCRHMGWKLGLTPRGKRKVCGENLFRSAA